MMHQLGLINMKKK